MFTAMLYVWPKTPMLQLRAGVCVLAVALMRLLNLAVPILYRDVVNVLSDASNINHPRPGEAPGTVNFWHVSQHITLFVLSSCSRCIAGPPNIPVKP